MAKVALITGANGITGSAIVEYLSKTTTAAEWARIIVTSRLPLQTTLEGDSRVEFIALDFTSKPADLVEAMRENALFENFLDSLLLTSNHLQNVVLQTGGKYYNVHLGPGPSPCREELPRRGKSEDNFYFAQEDFLAERQKGQSWAWNVVRPEAIIGTTAKPNGMNSAVTYALYFLICKELGEEARMPTNQIYWKGVETHSDARLLARFTIWASAKPECSNEAFNFVDGDLVYPQYFWPRLAEWFGAHATPEQQFSKPAPKQGEVQQDFSLADWSRDKKSVWDRLCDRAGVPEAKATFDAGTWQYQDWVFMRTWYPTLSMNKARKFGWQGHVDSYESLTTTFVRMRELRQIP